MYKNIHYEQKISEALNKFGFSELRPPQVEPIRSILDGSDTLVQLPTSGGKSAIFQIPAEIMKPRTTLVFSPLKALQNDQTIALRRKGIAARLLNSDLSHVDFERVLMEVENHEVTILSLAPEQLTNPQVRAVLDKADIAQIVIDEAHILAHEQKSFRKAYKELGKFIAELPHRPVVSAFTATATKADRKTIVKSLGMIDPVKYIHRIRRDNLHIAVKVVEARPKEKKRDAIRRGKHRFLKSYLDKWNGKGSVIIYRPTVKEVKATYRWLKARGYNAGKYHGKMKKCKRTSAQAKFLNGEVPIMVATNAFGLGIDKPDVRMIIHVGLPLSIDGYVQEIGRAGRDGKKARCVLIYAPCDYAANKALLSHSTKKKHRGEVLARLNALNELVKSERCIWKDIERYFGEKKHKKCGKCCRCRR